MPSATSFWLPGSQLVRTGAQTVNLQSAKPGSEWKPHQSTVNMSIANLNSFSNSGHVNAASRSWNTRPLNLAGLRLPCPEADLRDSQPVVPASSAFAVERRVAGMPIRRCTTYNVRMRRKAMLET